MSYVVCRILQFSQHTKYQQGFIKLTKKSLVIGLAAWLIIISSGIYLMFFNPKSASAAWYDDNWAYRQKLPIDTHTAAETNVYNEITVDTATLTTDKLQADCDDLRFTKENGEILPYQIVSGCDSATTTIRVGFDTMPAAPFNIYMYYGNPQAPAGSTTLSHSACGNGCAEGSFASEEKAPGPAAYWKFDDPSASSGQVAQDSTTNNNDGTLGANSGSGTDDPTWVSEDMCLSGKCLKFDGGDYVDLSTSNNLRPGTGNFTASVWIKDGAISNWDSIIGDRNGGSIGSAQGWVISLSSDTSPQGGMSVILEDSLGNAKYYTTSTEYDDSNWHHLAFTWNATSQVLTLYADGKSLSVTKNNDATLGSISPSTNINIGRQPNNTNHFNGFIDEVKIYPYARSAAQILADYNSRGTSKGLTLSTQGETFKNLSNGLVGYWKMDESSGNATDSSGNGSTLTNTNVATFAAGKFGNAASLSSASSQYFTVADNSTLSTGDVDFTVSAWVNATTLGTNYIMGKFGQNLAQREWELEYSGSRFKFGVSNGSSTTQVTANNFGAASTGTWYLVTAWHDSVNNTINISVNGGTPDSLSYSNGSVDGTAAFEVGTGEGSAGPFWNGKIDEVRIYKRALSPAEVSQLYNFAPGPRVELKMEEGSGTSANDSSGNANTGTVNSGTWTTGKYGKGVNVNGTTGSDVSVPDFSY